MKTCLRCGYEWEPRKVSPRQCPYCKSPQWSVRRNPGPSETVLVAPKVNHLGAVKETIYEPIDDI
jgi:hypothetical protein